MCLCAVVLHCFVVVKILKIGFESSLLLCIFLLKLRLLRARLSISSRAAGAKFLAPRTKFGARRIIRVRKRERAVAVHGHKHNISCIRRKEGHPSLGLGRHADGRPESKVVGGSEGSRKVAKKWDPGLVNFIPAPA